MKMENLFVSWQQRSAPASMPISVSRPFCILHKDLWPFLGHCSSVHCPVSPGWGAGDPEAVIPTGALLRNCSAL